MSGVTSPSPATRVTAKGRPYSGRGGDDAPRRSARAHAVGPGRALAPRVTADFCSLDDAGRAHARNLHARGVDFPSLCSGPDASGSMEAVFFPAVSCAKLLAPKSCSTPIPDAPTAFACLRARTSSTRPASMTSGQCSARVASAGRGVCVDPCPGLVSPGIESPSCRPNLSSGWTKATSPSSSWDAREHHGISPCFVQKLTSPAHGASQVSNSGR